LRERGERGQGRRDGEKEMGGRRPRAASTALSPPPTIRGEGEERKLQLLSLEPEFPWDRRTEARKKKGQRDIDLFLLKL